MAQSLICGDTTGFSSVSRSVVVLTLVHIIMMFGVFEEGILHLNRAH